jgi:hypothetical protein
MKFRRCSKLDGREFEDTTSFYHKLRIDLDYMQNIEWRIYCNLGIIGIQNPRVLKLMSHYL